MVGRYVRCGGMALCVVSFAVAFALAGTSTAEATTVGSCNVVAVPSPTQITSCPGTYFGVPFPKPVNLSLAYLSYSSFIPGPVTGLAGADVSYADLSWTTLEGVDLSGTDLSGADLTGANLSHADLTNASLIGVQLSGANLTDAVLTNADLTGASTVGVTWSGTTCPDGADSDSVGGTCVNDSAVQSGFSNGAEQDAATTATTSTTTPQNPSTGNPSTANGSDNLPYTPYAESTTQPSLAFTGAPVGAMAAIGLALVGIGLLLCGGRLPRLRRRSRPLLHAR